jgi:hypothetical protein
LYVYRWLILASTQFEVADTNIERPASKSNGNTYFSEPSGIVALILEAEADEHPPPPVPANVALLGSTLRTDATALSICEDMVEKGRVARFRAERVMREIDYSTVFLRDHIECCDRKDGASDLLFAAMTLTGEHR